MTPYPISDEWKAAGLQFQDQFTNFNLSYLNGGIFVGGPPVNDGVRLDGTNQYVYYETPRFHAAAGFTIELKFVPNFEFGDSIAHYIFDGTPSLQLTVTKHSDNTIQIFVDGSLIVWSASFGAYWLVNQENSLIISATSGDTTVYLNGTKVIDSSAVAFGNFLITKFNLGSAFNGTSKFNGIIKSFKYFTNAFTDADCEKLYDGRLLSELDPEKATLFAGLRSSYTNGAGEEVTPILINGETQEMFLGSDGKTAGEKPTMPLFRRGASFDGGDYFNAGDRDEFTPSDPIAGDKKFSICFYLQTTNIVIAAGIIGKYLAVSNGEFLISQASSRLRFLQTDMNSSGYFYQLVDDPLIVGKAEPWVCTSDASGAGTGLKIYRNGIRAADTLTSVGAYTQMRNSSQNLLIGSHGNGVKLAAGSRIYLVQIPPIGVELSPAQARMWTARARRLKNV
jgi:hypothetical protein